MRKFFLSPRNLDTYIKRIDDRLEVEMVPLRRGATCPILISGAWRHLPQRNYEPPNKQGRLWQKLHTAMIPLIILRYAEIINED